MEVIANDVAKKKQILIFCNKASTSAYVSNFLNDQGIESLHFAGGNMHPSKRQYNLKRDELSLFRRIFDLAKLVFASLNSRSVVIGISVSSIRLKNMVK